MVGRCVHWLLGGASVEKKGVCWAGRTQQICRCTGCGRLQRGAERLQRPKMGLSQCKDGGLGMCCDACGKVAAAGDPCIGLGRLELHPTKFQGA